jgi:hypothetical protein
MPSADGSPAGQDKVPMNILLLTDDQHRWDWFQDKRTGTFLFLNVQTTNSHQ